MKKLLEAHHSTVGPLDLESSIAKQIQSGVTRHHDGVACERRARPQTDRNAFGLQQLHALHTGIHEDGRGMTSAAVVQSSGCWMIDAIPERKKQVVVTFHLIACIQRPEYLGGFAEVNVAKRCRLQCVQYRYRHQRWAD